MLYFVNRLGDNRIIRNKLVTASVNNKGGFMNGQIYSINFGEGKLEPMRIGGLEVGAVYTMALPYHDHADFCVVQKEVSEFAYGQRAIRLDKPTHISDLSPSSIGRLGIGGLTETGKKLSLIEVAALIVDSDRERAKEKEERDNAKNEREANLKKGKEIFNSLAPSWAKSAIVAELKENTSGPYDDYSSSKTTKAVLLGFSKTERDMFPEMRKFAALFEPTKYLADGPEKFEHREKYSMGKGFYLSEYYHSGWVVSKDRLKYGIGDAILLALARGDEMPVFSVQSPEINQAPTAIQEGPNACEMTLNAEKHGVELRFSEKPSEEVRKELKTNGFRWSSNQGIWYARQGVNTVSLAIKLSHQEGKELAA